MSGMFWVALELSFPKIGFNVMLSLTVEKLVAFNLDEVAESDNTELHRPAMYVFKHSFLKSRKTRRFLLSKTLESVKEY